MTRAHLYTVAIAAVAAIGGFLFGFDSGVINGTVDALSAAFGSGDVGAGFSVASVLLGCAVGALLAGPTADRLGRRPVMLVTAVVFAASAWGSGIAETAPEFVAYRLLGGLGVGAASVLAPAYISEIAPAHLRGRLASLQQLAIVVGLFSAFVSNYVLADASGGAAEPWLWGVPTWRWMFWMEIAPAAAFFLGSLAIPESPRHLVRVGRLEGAQKVFARLGIAEPSEEVERVQASLGRAHRPRIADLRGPFLGLQPIVWVGIALSAFQQLIGINVVFYYGALLWQAAGFGEEQALAVNVITGLTNIVATFVAIALVDRIGRKPLLVVGSAGMALTLGTLAVVFGSAAPGPDGTLALAPGDGLLALGAANLYVVFFAVSWGPVVWVLLGEMFDNRIRGSALALSASAQWVANFAVTMTFPVLLAHIGLRGAYGLYAAAAAVSLVFVGRFVVETRGRSLEQIATA